MLATLARTCYRHRRLVIVGWIGLVIVLQSIAGVFGGDAATDFNLPGSESVDAQKLLERGGFPARAGIGGQVVVRAPQGVDDPAVKTFFEKYLGDIAAGRPGLEVRSPYVPTGRRQVSADGKVAFAEIGFGDVTPEKALPPAHDVKELLNDERVPTGVDVAFGGDIFADEIKFSSEAFGFLAAAIILFLAFGSVLAMGLPLAIAAFGIACGLALVTLWANVFSVPGFTSSSVAIVSIGVGIDYALFIVTRYREELAAGSEPEEAVVTALSTAGRAVVFAGSTVVISLLGLMTIRVASMASLAVTMASGVLMVLLAAITLLPALLGFAGRNIDRLGLRHRAAAAEGSGGRSIWYRWSRYVQRRPWHVLLVGGVLVLALAAPVLSIRLGFGDAGNRPRSDTSRRAYDLLADGFGPGFNGPLFLAVDLGGTDAGARQAFLAKLESAVRADPGVQAVVPPLVNKDGSVALIQAFPATSPQDKATVATVHRLRRQVIRDATTGTGAEVLVGGVTPASIDFSNYIKHALPVFIGAVLVLSFLLLMAVFRSILVPLKAVIMNLLSIGAAAGLVVAFFQWSWFGELLGHPGPVEPWAPVIMFAVVFGLSMDYEVFLLSRIREEYLRTGDNASAVADGLAKTARLITAAAAIMVFVFGGFLLSPDRGLRMLGMGLTSAVFVDATLVRMLLVPATMELLGDRNWWLPRRLERVVPHLGVEG
ncbi:MAG: MMPL family transporter [Acidobacteria bacterium]|nr:MMPL family transporter [Acidobacteriota bacterium]